MRNVNAGTIPAGATLYIKINPPVPDDEIPFLWASRGKGTVVIAAIDTQTVSLTNPTDITSPYIFFVTKRSALRGVTTMQQVLRNLGVI